MTESQTKFQFAIDRGGTFTDIYAKCPNGKIRVMKLLSVDPQNYDDAPREGIRRILEQESGIGLDENGKVDASRIEWIRMGTTVATNALLERQGERIALIINSGFKDLLFIGNQARPNIFQLDIKTPEVLYSKVVEVNCRVIPAQLDKCKLPKCYRIVEGSSREKLYITHELNETEIKEKLQELHNEGFQSIAVVLAHSYTFHQHELRIGELAREIGFQNVSLSHQVMPMVRLVPRGFTACADAYLTPHIQKYLKSFAQGFKDDLRGINVLFMQSDGGLTPMQQFNGSRAILSGPAGGVVGYAVTTYNEETQQPVIGFDMGGTSTDVSRFAGTYEHVFESTTAGVTIQCPQLDVNTVAAGGGSRLFFRSGLFVVGPESAGAHPGPTCYKKNGYLTVTDANLTLGRILPEYFPKIFGPNENEPLDKVATISEFEKLQTEINLHLSKQNKPPMSLEEVAMGYIEVANEAMCRPIRSLTQAKGYDTTKHILACFGGAGGQHACAIAKALGMSTVFVHKYAGILSAYGMALADVVQEAQESSACAYSSENFQIISERFEHLSQVCVEKLVNDGFGTDAIHLEHYLHLRYDGTDCALMCSSLQSPANSDSIPKWGNFKESFLKRYQTEFGFTLPNRPIIIDDIRVRGIGKTSISTNSEIKSFTSDPHVEQTTKVFFDNKFYPTNIYLLSKLHSGHKIQGPAIIMDQLSTILVEPNCLAEITPNGDIKITIGSGQVKKIGIECDSIQLSIFSHRFMSIAEQMGRILQRTSISTNIKERLDFSCALFDATGGLVSNAPHIPVHLGAMQETVQYQLLVSQGGEGLRDGDVLLSNHPQAGGSHLPDLTVITPVFYRDVPKPVFFVASRGHHADIGGITPGSMPPHSQTLDQEGAQFKSFKLIDQGVFKEKELIEEFMKPSLKPGCSGARNISDNISDLKAQVAANKKGIQLVTELIDVYGLDVVQAYMHYIQENAELSVRNMLREVGQKAAQTGETSLLQAVDYLDDGSPIKVTISISVKDGSAICDFSGSGYEVVGNCNAPRAIAISALIYCLRCMVGHDVPLNQGCLKPITIIIPKGSILDPSENAAVVGGNVQTSQRIVDVIFKAFAACAASQGCMNNITFGDESWGYYETVAGGSGAGPGWDGRGGVHTHMTNTRITDPEILERRYPVILNHFSLRPNSGGEGCYRGGDGVVRELIFRKEMTLSILTERRAMQPYGLEGGQPGERGVNLLIKNDGRVVNLGPKTAIDIQPGDKFRLMTPGGGGFGNTENRTQADGGKPETSEFTERGSVYEYRKAQESV